MSGLNTYKTWEDKLRICRRLFGRIKNDGGGGGSGKRNRLSPGHLYNPPYLKKLTKQESQFAIVSAI